MYNTHRELLELRLMKSSDRCTKASSCIYHSALHDSFFLMDYLFFRSDIVTNHSLYDRNNKSVLDCRDQGFTGEEKVGCW